MDAGSVHSVPSSVSGGGSSARSTPVPTTYRPITQSSSTLALAKLSNEEMTRRSSDDLVQIIRRLENENRNLVGEHGTILKDVNKRTQILLLEVRGLKDINQNLQDDNQELRDLCCFLDDDRQRGRKLAREWQRFGRYTASVMRSEVSAYQEKLKELEFKQQELISDNLNLKELCLYLDQERLRLGQTRDEGDGSSSSTLPGNEDSGPVDGIELVPMSQLPGGNVDNTNASSEYVRLLEEKVRQLEEEKRDISQRLEGKSVPGPGPLSSRDKTKQTVSGSQRLGPDGNQPQDGTAKGTSPNKPEAVVHAMKVLEVHENLERPHTTVGEENHLDDKEKAIVREMCNVVWRKLGNVSAEQRQQQDSESSTPHPVYENIQPTRSRSPVLDLPPAPHPPHAEPQPPRTLTDQQGHPQGHKGVFTAQPLQQRPGRQRSEGDQRGVDERRAKSESQTGLRESQAGFREPDVATAGKKRETGHRGQYESRSDPSDFVQGHRSDLQHVTAYPAVSQYPRPDVGQPYQGSQPKSPQSGQSQRSPEQPSQYPSNPAPPPHSNQPPKYGYIHTSRSTPVTPTPPQRSHSPSAGTGRHSVPRSHSPRSGSGQKYPSSSRSDSQLTQSGGSHSQHRPQYPRSESQPSAVSQSHHPYQNHQPLKSNGDHSYENISHGYFYTSSHDRSDDSQGVGYEPPGSQYTYNETQTPNPAHNLSGYSHPHYRATNENQAQSRYSLSQAPNYQNINIRNSTAPKQTSHEAPPSHYTSQQNPSHSDSFAPQRNQPRNVPYPASSTSSTPSHSSTSSSNRRGQPQYQDRHSFADPRDRPQYSGDRNSQYLERQDGRGRSGVDPDGRGRGGMDQYYRK